MKRVNSLCLLSALAICLLASCGQNQEQKKEAPVVEETKPVVKEEKSETQVAIVQVRGEVIEIHDRSMAQMSEIHRLSRQLKDSIENTNVNPMEQEEVINRYRNHLKGLNDANQEMLQWMRQFNEDGENMEEQEKLEYFRKEKVKISKVDSQINEAVKSAREVLRK